jgi:hypothetical protein
MPSHAILPTGYSSCCFSGDVMTYLFYDLHSNEQNKGELLFKIVVYKFKYITKKGRTCVCYNVFFSAGFQEFKGVVKHFTS